MLFIDDNHRSRLHAFCHYCKKAVQVFKPAQCPDGDNHQIELFFILTIDVVDIDSLKRTGQVQFLRFCIREGDLILGNVKACPFCSFSAFHQRKKLAPVIAAELTDRHSLRIHFPQDVCHLFFKKRIVFILNPFCYVGSPGGIPVVKSLLPCFFVSFYILFHL